MARPAAKLPRPSPLTMRRRRQKAALAHALETAESEGLATSPTVQDCHEVTIFKLHQGTKTGITLGGLRGPPKIVSISADAVVWDGVPRPTELVGNVLLSVNDLSLIHI